MSAGQKIKQKRKEKKLSQQELADILRVTRQSVSGWERNKGVPTAENLNELTSFFKVPSSYFLGKVTPTVLENEFNADRALLIVVVNMMAALQVDNTILKTKLGLISPKKALISHQKIVARIFAQAKKAAPLLKDWPFPDHQ